MTFKNQKEFEDYADSLYSKTVRLKKIWKPDPRRSKTSSRAFFKWNLNRYLLLHISKKSPEKMSWENKWSQGEAVGYL